MEWRQPAVRSVDWSFNGCLIEKSDALIEILDQVPGLVNVRSNAESSREEVLIRVFPERVAGFGLTAQDVGRQYLPHLEPR